MAQGNLTPLGFGAQGFDPFSVLRRELEQLIEGPGRGGAQGSAGTVLAPRINISEDDREIRITAEMPGMRPEDVQVTVHDDMLTIRGEQERERETDRRNYHLVERVVGVFQRTVRLPFPVDPGQVQARVNNGVLTLTIPKNDPKRSSQRIEVRGGDAEGNGAGRGGDVSGGGTAGASSQGSGSTSSGGSGTDTGDQTPHH
jgi:HSP20 family protein